MTEFFHILVVDDNPENIRLLGTALRQQNNYHVTVARNGKMALQGVEQQIPDLILLDVMMPEMNGFELCKILKSDPKTQDIEIIFVTAAVADTDQLTGLELGAIDYIYKPYSLDFLLTKVALHLERARIKKELRLKAAALEEIVRLRDDIERITRHDLKTPLNAIIGYPQIMLMDDNLTDEQREYLEEILRAGNEMINMVNSSLDLFKMETGRYQYTPESVDISLMINKIFRDLTHLAEQHKITLEMSLQLSESPQSAVGGGGFIVQGEKTLCYSLFANLIRNAIEASPANGSVLVVMRYEEDYGVIAITNTGSVPETIRETFFEKYATAGKSHGTGLGTYSAKLMVTTQKGTITMDTNEHKTCITVRLPCQKA